MDCRARECLNIISQLQLEIFEIYDFRPNPCNPGIQKMEKFILFFQAFIFV